MSFLKKKERRNKNRKQARFRLSPLQLQLLWGFVLFCAVALVLTGVWYLSRIPSLQIENIEVVGGKTIAHAQIKEATEEALRGEYLHLIPKRFIPMYPKDTIAQNIYAIDRVKNVHIEIEKNQTLLIAFEEHIPYGLWCATLEAGGCLFLDRSGFAFAQAPSLEGSAFVRYVDEDVVPSRDINGFDASYIKDTEAFIIMLEKELGLYATHVFKRGTYDIDFTISGGGVIKISQTIPMAESFENLKTILLSEEFKHIEPGSFQYIDLRFGEKIFVNEELPSESQATSTAPSSNSL